MTTAKEKLVARLLEGGDDIVTEFVIFGLEDSLDTICNEVKRLLKVENLSDIQQTDLNDLYNNGLATIQVLKYYNDGYYTIETKLMSKAWAKLIDRVF
jgi:hypothetical protein